VRCYHSKVKITLLLLVALPLALAGASRAAEGAVPLRLLDRPDRQEEAAPGSRQAILLDAPSFSGSPGSWSISGYPGALTGTILMGLTDGRRERSISAERTVEVETPGEYRVWVRCWDSNHDQPGSRFFDVSLGEDFYAKRFGATGRNGFGWEDGGVVNLPAGPLRVQLVDSSAHFARFDALFLTQRLGEASPQLVEHLHAQARPEAAQVSEVKLDMPAWAAAGPSSEAARIGNDRVRVRFFQNSEGERRAVRPVVELAQNGSWVQMTDPEQVYAHLVVFADECRTGADYSFASTFYESVRQDGDKRIEVNSPSIYQAGLTEWLVPETGEPVDEKSVRLRARGETADLEVVWSVESDAAEPKVTWTLLPKKDGVFSVGSFHGPERNIGSLDYILCGKIYLGLYAPPIACLVREQVSPNQMNLVTAALDPAAGLGDRATFGIIVDPASAPFRWAKADTSLFGFGLRSPGGDIQPMVFAPLPDSGPARMVAGESYSFSYRPVSRLADWFETYSDLAERVLRVRDQKSNHDTSLTETIFNIQDLILSATPSSGWHDKAMAFAYVETGKNSGGFNHSSPLAILQNALLTGDAEWMEQRAIPTLAFFLSRPGAWIDIPPTGPGKTPQVLDGPRGGYPSSVLYGFYQMSGGRIPAFQKIALDGPLRSWSAASGQKLDFVEKINRYRVTRDETLLAQARREADEYIAKFVDPPTRGMTAGVGFEILTTAPWTPALLAMHEVTGEANYLEAAHRAAAKLLAHGTWIAPLVPDGEMTIRAEDLNARGLLRDENHVGSSNAGWNGFTRAVLGYEFLGDWNANRVPMKRKPEAWKNFGDVTAPAWVLSRIGLNVEHATQLARKMGWDSPNITMNCYAPDFLRIAELTGDNLFRTVARHETLSRAANYPGYYLNNMMNIHRAKDYPYTGPDVSVIEFTHIPAYLAKLQDFLFTQVWSLSGRRIEFPSTRQYGYAYFDNKVYGFAPGRFFDLEGIWPWMKRGVIESDNRQIDWLAGRKDGMFVAALVNQSEEDQAATITLGPELPAAGRVRIYSADGQTSEVAFTDRQLAVTVSARGLVGLAIASMDIRAPAHAVQIASSEPDRTSAPVAGRDDYGSGYALQIQPGPWYAYSFLKQTPDQVQEATLHYRIGDGEWRSEKVSSYPFEKIVKVESAGHTFTFYWEVTLPDGSSRKGREKVVAAFGSPPDKKS
jgi:hypothetical protein